MSTQTLKSRSDAHWGTALLLSAALSVTGLFGATAAQADALNAQADQVEKNADRKADMVEQQAGNADGGMTTANTPSTH